MKTKLARLICLNAVLLLFSGILFASNVQTHKESSYKKLHYSSQTETSVDVFTFLEEEEDDESVFELFTFDNRDFFYTFQIQYFPKISIKTEESFRSFSTEKTPIWIKIRRIIQ